MQPYFTGFNVYLHFFARCLTWPLQETSLMSVAAHTINSAFNSFINNSLRGGRFRLAAVFKRRHISVLSKSVFGNESRHILLALCLLLMTGLAAMPAMAAPDLFAGTGSGEPGQSVLIPVTVDTDGSVAALQLDLSFDASLLSVTGSVAGGALADHVFDWQEVAPGQVRLIFTTASASALSNGVLATLTLLIDDEAEPGTIPLMLDSVVQSDALSILVNPTGLTDGSVEVLDGGTVYHPLSVPSLGNLGILPLLILFLLAVWVMHQRGLAGISFSVLLGVTLFSSTIVRGAIPPGDANDDGVVNAADIPVIVQQILERSIAPGDPDCNEDLLVDVRDTICAANLTENHAPDLYGPGNRLIQADNLFQSPLFATDPDFGDVLTFELDSAPAGMSIDPVSGLLSWAPNGSNLGNNSVTALVRDSLGLTDTETFNVEVFQPVALAASNAPPVLTVPGLQTLVFGDPLSAAASATDGDNDPLTFSLVNAPAGMAITGGSGSINWTPQIAQIGAHDVTVKVSDPHGGVDFGSFIVEVFAVNGAPTANDNVYEARLGVPLTINPPGVLANDTDPDEDPLTSVLVDDAGQGELTLNSDGSFDYLLESIDPTTPVELEILCDTSSGSLSRPSTIFSEYQGDSTLAVGDVDNDGDLEIVGIGGIAGSPAFAEVWFTNALDCSDQFHTGTNVEAVGGFNSTGHPGLHDIDGDGDLEIMGVRERYPNVAPGDLGDFDREHLIAIHHDGTLAWPGDGGSETSAIFDANNSQSDYFNQGPAFVDLEGDGTTEIVMASSIGGGNGVQSFVVVYNAVDGSIKWEYLSPILQSGQNDARMPYVVDLDLDGTMEVIVHNSVIDHTGVLEFVLPSLVIDSPLYSEGHLTLGIGNFDDDAYPELVGRDLYNYYMFEHDGTLVWEFEKPNRVSDQIAVADFDGDGELEFADVGNITIGTAGGGIVGIQVFNADGSVLWDHGDKPEFHAATGDARYNNITAFDANRDGAMDIVYRNTNGNVETLFIFDGRDGTVLTSVPADGYTGHRQRFNTIADINGDGHAEIINSYHDGLDGKTEIWTGTAANPLPKAPAYRHQWNFQPAYVNDDLTIPAKPIPHWLRAGYNGYHMLPPDRGVDLELECQISLTEDGSRYLGNKTLAVGDVDNDGDLDIVGTNHIDGSTAAQELWLLNASDCSEQAYFNLEASGAFEPTSHPGLLDIDGDGDLEIITTRHFYPQPTGGIDGEHLIAVHHDGTLAWPGDGGSQTSPLIESLTGFGYFRGVGPTFADLDADGNAEILIGFTQFPNTTGAKAGLVVFNASDGSIAWEYLSGSNGSSGEIRIPTVADLDLDGTMEVIIQNQVLSHEGLVELTLPSYVTPGIAGTLVTAVANFDGDAFPEILARDNRNHYLFNHDGTVVWEIERRNFANSQLTVADFNGDGELEYAHVNCEPSNPGGSACPTYYLEVFDSEGASLWSHQGIPALELQSGNSRAENISAFDANRDGALDLVFQNIDINVDRLLIIDGRDGSVLDSVAVGSYGSSGVQQAFITIADVDGDGAAELLTSHTGGIVGETQVWGGFTANPLPSAPAFRNQWSFQPTYASAGGKAMLPNPVPHWLQPGQNGWNLIKPDPDPLIGTTDTFTYKANDGALDSNVATVTLDILPAGSPPVFLTLPDTLTPRGFPYSYEPIVADPDPGDVVTFSLTAGPSGMGINTATGAISWNPQINGSYDVSILALDSIGFATAQSWVLEVGDPVVVPDVIGQTEAAAEVSLNAENLVVGTTRRATHPSIPDGSVFDQTPPAGAVAKFGGAINLWISLGPAPEDIDNDGDSYAETAGDCDDSDNSIYPGATDSAGDGIDQDCDGIDGNLILDSILVLPGETDVLTSQSINLKAYGIFEDGTSQNLTGVVTWSNGPSFSSSTAGSFSVTAAHSAINGNATINVHAHVTGDDVPPTALITSPDNNSTVTEPVDIIGTASDTNFLKYELAYAIAGSDGFTIFSSSTNPVTGGSLGEFDPTLLINDLYTIRLTVFDLGGNTTSDEITVQVDELMKIGQFTLSFIDLSIPMAGIPINVVRTYDSREKRKGDFGVGWFLGVNSLRLSTNRMLGTGWRVAKVGLTYNLVSTDVHTVSLVFPGERVERFRMVVSPSVSPIVPFPPYSQSVSFVPLSGTLGQLKSLDENNVSILDSQPGDADLRRDSDGEIYNPEHFRYTALDGLVIDIHIEDGVERMVDPNGNELTYGPGGITHSGGQSISFARDAQNRITSITDPNGNIRLYSYDGNGDLRSDTDWEGNKSQYSYNLNHHMLDMVTPDGNQPVRNEYDDDGRLVAVTDALGHRTEVNHDLGARQQITTDRNGHVSVSVYDERGNILTRTNALGHTTTYTYDSNDNVLSTTDPLGNTRTFTHDAFNKLLTETDPLGNTTTHSYDPVNALLLSTTDPLGNLTSYQYDTRRNLIRVTEPLGHFTHYTYDSSGNRISAKDALGNTDTFNYDASGRMLSSTDPSGNITTYTYDANGNLLTQTQSRTTPSGTENLTTTRVYDGRNLLIETIDPLGNSVLEEYNAVGIKTARIDKNGNKTSYHYGPRGRLARTVYPDGSEVNQAYDANGNNISTTDRGGKTTTRTFDSLNRLTLTSYPDGATGISDYDSAGRLQSSTDARGNSTIFGYDAAGRKTTATNALGQVTSYGYDANGMQVSVTDANGNETEFDYDANGKQIKTKFADGTFTTGIYDELGQKIADIDQAGVTTSYEWHVNGNLSAVIDALGQVTSYAYDEVDNRVSTTDANGNTTLYEFDKVGRLTRLTRPEGTVEFYDYDANGNMTSVNDFNGKTTQYEFDEVNRLTIKTLPDASEISFTYNSAGTRSSVTDHRGTTSYSYDNRNRLVQQIEPDGSSLDYAYDLNGNRTSLTIPSGTTTYEFDALNRLEMMTHPGGGWTQYDYDPAGWLLNTHYPNGVVTTYTRDDLNRVVLLENRKSDTSLLSSFSYALHPTGRRLQIVDHTGRTVDYAHDLLYRLESEDIQDAVLGDELIEYTYDPVGNRLSMSSSSGITNYSYDTNDRLLSDGANTHSYDSNGNLISRSEPIGTTTFDYDDQGRLVSVTDPGGDTVLYDYDADNIRVQSTDNGQETHYLVDRNRLYAQVLEERDGLGSLIVSYEYGADLVSQTRAGNTHFYLYDAHGSTKQLVNDVETVTDTYEYDAFGRELHNSGSTQNSYLYTGEQFDEAAGMYHLRARYYDQHRGRFPSTDPYSGELALPMSLHRYLYTYGDPVNNIDPSGEISSMDVLMYAGLIAAVGVVGIMSVSSFRANSQDEYVIPVLREAQRVAGALSAEINQAGYPDDYFNKKNKKKQFPGLSTWHANIIWGEIESAINPALIDVNVGDIAGSSTTVLELERTDDYEYNLEVSANFQTATLFITKQENFGGSLLPYQVGHVITAFSQMLGWPDAYPESTNADSPAKPIGGSVSVNARGLSEYGQHAQRYLGGE